ALHGVLANFPSPLLGAVLKRICFPFGRTHAPSGDRTGARLAQLLMNPTDSRERLIQGAFQSTEGVGAGMVARAFEAVLASEETERIVANGLRRQPSPVNVEQLAREAVDAGLIDEQQAHQLIEAQRLSAEVIAVDEFGPDELSGAQYGEAESPLKLAS
ncbi:MAG: acyl-CoA dehydrogenase domain-containing protein, partial [Wenzhouxiangellaceae bacterium]